MMNSKWWITLLRVFLGVVLLFAAIAKLTSFGTFVSEVSAYQILPTVLVKPISYLLVSAEITLGIGLVVGYFSRGMGIHASILFLIFAVALANVLLHKIPMSECGCRNILFTVLDLLGISDTTPNWTMVFADIGMAIASFGLACSPQQGYALDSLISN